MTALQPLPEHFDVAIELDAVNYGFSPGDEHFRSREQALR